MYNVILPTFNESENIGCAIKLVSKYLKVIGSPFKIIVVDDNSPDNTYQVVKDLMDEYPIELVKREKKEGLGSAYMKALEYCEYEYVIIMDADLSHDPKHIIDFIFTQRKSNCDIVTGTRYNGGGVHGWNFKRKLISRTANNIARTFLDLKMSDLTGSYRLYKRSVLINLLNQVDSIGYSIQLELAFLAEKNNLKIIESPIFFYDRMAGESKLTRREIFSFLKTILFLLVKP